jgi:hypothetical protein
MTLKLAVFVTTFFACMNVFGQSPSRDMSDMKKTETKQLHQNNKLGIDVFVKNYRQYRLDIEAAGIATIPSATLDKNQVLTIEYVYRSEGENRTGKMILRAKRPAYFEGDWKTNADNGNVYQGALFLIFEADGTAKGSYRFSGADHKISVVTGR